MRVKISSRNFDLKEKQHAHIEEKVQVLSKFMDIDHVEVILKKEGFKYEADLLLKAMHKNFVLKKKAEVVDEIIDILVDKMSHLLSKHKEKVKSHQNQKSQEIVNEVGAENPYSLIYGSIESLDEYTHQEAADKLIVTGDKFLVYVDSYTKKMSVAILKDEKTIEFIES